MLIAVIGSAEKPTFEEASVPNISFSNADDKRLLKELYERYYLAPNQSLDHKGIPKIIHQVWIGSKVPDRYKEMMKSWQELHPDWTYILWTDDMIDAFPMENRHLFDQVPNYSSKVDIWTFEILYRYGGLYVDTDFEALLPFDELNENLDFYTGGISCGEIYYGLVGAVPGHPIMRKCIDGLKDRPVPQAIDGQVSFEGILSFAGPYYFGEKVLEVLHQGVQEGYERCVVFPEYMLYPFPAEYRWHFWRLWDRAHYKHTAAERELMSRFLKSYSFAVHYFATSWQKT